jgi:hypothetical protein
MRLTCAIKWIDLNGGLAAAALKPVSERFGSLASKNPTLDLCANFAEAARTLRTALDEHDYVVAEFCFDYVARLAGLERKDSVVKSGGVRVASEEAEVAAAGARSRVFGVRASKLRKILAAARLRQDRGRARSAAGHLFGGGSLCGGLSHTLRAKLRGNL